MAVKIVFLSTVCLGLFGFSTSLSFALPLHPLSASIQSEAKRTVAEAGRPLLQLVDDESESEAEYESGNEACDPDEDCPENLKATSKQKKSDKKKTDDAPGNDDCDPGEDCSSGD